MLGLDRLIDNSVNNPEGVEVQLSPLHLTAGDQFVLLMEVVEELESAVRYELLLNTRENENAHSRSVVAIPQSASARKKDVHLECLLTLHSSQSRG